MRLPSSIQFGNQIEYIYIFLSICKTIYSWEGNTQWAQIHGRRECTDEDVEAILLEISKQCGSSTLHRIKPPNTSGEEYLETAGRNAMLGPEDMAVDENSNDASSNHITDMVRLVTMNVAGLCEDLGPAGRRMDEILTKLFADAKPDVLCFQEVTDEMYRERSVWIPNPPNLPVITFFQTFPTKLPF